MIAANSDWRVVNAWDYGDLYLLEELWRRLGIPEVIAAVLAGRTSTLNGNVHSMPHRVLPSRHR
jgi:hypothetical protein